MSINKRFAHLNHSGSNHSILDAETVYVTGTLQVGPNVSALGSDVNFFVSGNIGGEQGATPGVGVFGGDLVVSGNLHFLGGITGSIPGYWASETAGEIFTSASLVNVPSGSVHAQFLSASNGAEITGSLKVASGNILETLDIGWNSVSLGGGANSALTIQGVNGLVLDADASTLLVTASKTTFVGAGGITVGSDAVFFVSGATDKNSLDKAVFGGTVFVSGNLQAPYGAPIFQTRNAAGNGWLDVAGYLDGTLINPVYGNQLLIVGDADNKNTGIGLFSDGVSGLIALITGSNEGFFSGSYKFPQGLSGSLQMLTDGVTMFLTGAGGIQITNLPNGQIEISGSSQASVTQYWDSDVANNIFTTGSAVISSSLSVNPAGTGRGLLNVGGLDIGPITGSAFTSDAGIGGYSPNTILGGNLLSASFGVWQPGAAAMLRHELHVVGFGQNLIAGGLYNTFAATYLVSSFIDAAGNQKVIGATELSRETSGSNAATWDVNFAVNGDIEVSGVLGSVGTGLSDIVNWYGQRVKEMSINISGSRT